MKRFISSFCTLFVLFCSSAAHAQNAGAVTNHAFAIGKGPGVTGYTSLLCGSAQLAVGQAAADPICRTITGDATLSAAGAITLATVNSNVGSFGSATQCTSVTVNAKGLITAASQATCTPAVGSITGMGANVATWLGTPSSANLRAAITDETGTGLAYFQGGDLGTPSAGVITNLTGTCASCVANSFTAGSASNLTSGTLAVARGGVDQTAYTTWTPTISCGAGTITTLGTVTARRTQIGKIVFFYLSVTITTNGTCASNVNATLPVAAITSVDQNGVGRENGVTGKMLYARIVSGTSNMAMTFYDNTFPGANGAVLQVSGFYETP